MTDVRIDLSGIVGAVAAVFIKPWAEFVGQLQAEGRVTDAEVEALTAAMADRADRLGELVQELLRESDESR